MLLAFLLSCAMATTSPSELLISARRAAKLTQRDLAKRAETSQSVVARIENGTVSPTWSTMTHLLGCMDFGVHATLGASSAARSHMLDDVPRILRLTPEERLLELKNASSFFAAAKRMS